MNLHENSNKFVCTGSQVNALLKFDPNKWIQVNIFGSFLDADL